MISFLLKALEEKLRYAGSRLQPEEWVRRTAIYAVAAAIVVAALAAVLFGAVAAMAVFVLTLAAMPVARYVQLEMDIERRRIEVERILPDLLRVIAANISAGLTPIVAVRAAARPEFGAISKELKYLTARSMGSSSMEEITEEIKKRIRSDMLDRVLLMFTTSLRSGGDVVKALETSASDIQRISELHDSLVAQTSMYTTFVLFGIVVTMPFLLAVSISVMGLMSDITSAQQISYVAAYMSFGFPSISQEFLTVISVLVLVGSSLTASLLMGIIRAGNRIEGLKYFLPLFCAALAVFYISHKIAVPFIIGMLR
ncbi:MAG: type II secretion system F family protein [Candidatus Micrarchaeota archaeon]|nr:type II secretion system F family protein [Candidatus Micrarchaeota archaeon]